MPHVQITAHALFFPGKDWTSTYTSALIASMKLPNLFLFFFFPKKMECRQFTLTDSVSECAKNRKLLKTWGHAHSISCACAQTPAKAFRSAINHTHTHKSNMQLLLFHQDMDLFSCYYLRDGCCWLLNWSYVNTYSDSESY